MRGLGIKVAAKLKEPSTWIGLGSLATAVGWSVSPEHWQTISQVGMGLGGFLAVVLSESKA